MSEEMGEAVSEAYNAILHQVGIRRLLDAVDGKGFKKEQRVNLYLNAEDSFKFNAITSYRGENKSKALRRLIEECYASLDLKEVLG